jgi:hypothetical protein
MKKIGIALILLGVFGFFIGGVSFSTQETVVDAGPLEVEKTEENRLPITPYVSGGAVAVGIGLVVVGMKRNG